MLVTLDLDGTMFMGNSVLYLNSKLNVSEKLEEYHKSYHRGEITEAQLNMLQTPILLKVSLSRALEVLANGRLLKRIEPGVKLLRESGLDVAMLTFNPYQLLFKKLFGISCDISMIVDFESKGDEISNIKNVPNNKIALLRNYCSRNNIPLSKCIHVGDSSNDIPTFQEVGFAIALNADDEQVRRESDISLNTDDFSTVARAILDGIG